MANYIEFMNKNRKKVLKNDNSFDSNSKNIK